MDMISQMEDRETGRALHRRNWIQFVCREKYTTLLELVQGTFKVPKKDRTAMQRNAVRHYQRRRNSFSVVGTQLYFQGRQVIVDKDIPKKVKTRFQRNMGSGSRPIWKQLQNNYAGVSSRRVKEHLHRSTCFQETFATFTNKVPPKPVVSSAVNERWQVDLINMRKDQVLHHGKTHRYIVYYGHIFAISIAKATCR